MNLVEVIIVDVKLGHCTPYPRGFRQFSREYKKSKKICQEMFRQCDSIVFEGEMLERYPEEKVNIWLTLSPERCLPRYVFTVTDLGN